MQRKNIQKLVVFFILLLTFFVIGGIAVRNYFFVKHNTPLCKDCNILLISLDTCGAKHMSTYGYERDTTPNLTALAKEGILFKNMHTNATWTLPSHVSIFTGLYPMVHQVQKGYDTYLDSSVPLLPEILQQHGYETYFYAPSDELNIAPLHVYNRGITNWDTHYWEYGEKGDEYLKIALSQLEQNSKNNKKTFMFFHTYMCHGPYVTEDQPLLYTKNAIPSLPLKKVDIFEAPFTEGYYKFLLERIPEGIQNKEFIIAPQKIEELYIALQQADTISAAEQIYNNAVEQDMWGEVGMNDYKENYYYWEKIDVQNFEHILYIQALYDQGVHAMDKELFALFRSLYSISSWSKNTIIIITADHGEEFMEHGNLSHSTLYDFNTQVPLIVLIPGMKRKSINDHVQSVDITPTILDVVGIKYTYPFNGQSLVPLLFGDSLGKRLIIANGGIYQSNIVTIREGDWKLFVKNQDEVAPYKLFNTANDPLEQINILGKNMDRAKEMILKFSELKANSFLTQ